MFCNSCGAPIGEGEKFCTQCGTPVPQERLCPSCQAKVADNALFCGQCGTRLSAAPQTPPAYSAPQQPNTQANQTAYQATSYQNHGGYGQQPVKFQMISKYVGEPTVGISKATGTLSVYNDRLEFSKVLGNALGNLSAVTMGIAAKKAKQNDSKVEVFYFQDIQNAYVGKYAMLMPSVVLMLKDGQVFSFNGSFTNQSAQNVVNTILSSK